MVLVYMISVYCLVHVIIKVKDGRHQKTLIFIVLFNGYNMF